MKTVGYVCDVADCEELARFRFQRLNLPVPSTLPLGSQEPPPWGAGGLDLCPDHATRVQLRNGAFLVLHEAPAA